MLVGVQGEEIGKGTVFQTQDKWFGKNLEESTTCVVDVCELRVDKGLRLPYSSEAIGTTFADAQTKFGIMRIVWDLNKVLALRSD